MRLGVILSGREWQATHGGGGGETSAAGSRIGGLHSLTTSCRQLQGVLPSVCRKWISSELLRRLARNSEPLKRSLVTDRKQSREAVQPAGTCKKLKASGMGALHCASLILPCSNALIQVQATAKVRQLLCPLRDFLTHWAREQRGLSQQGLQSGIC